MKLKQGNLSWHCLSAALDLSLIQRKGLDLPGCYWNLPCVWVTVTVITRGSVPWRLVRAALWLFKAEQKSPSFAWMKGELCSVARNRAVIIRLLFLRSLSICVVRWVGTYRCPGGGFADLLPQSGARCGPDAVLLQNTACGISPAALAVSPNEWGCIKERCLKGPSCLLAFKIPSWGLLRHSCWVVTGPLSFMSSAMEMGLAGEQVCN